ncbi:hypothetical protein HYH03_016741 [Edaphochlamys debaryana]|uniref:Uncharacterized protein n=1 Tax=Edaphochlamys debaryana TaxID=47281 RepID=A0A835XLH2_9CHLO|nr:hypothetical protein HYH03_016741 [Edaphochlamys debaryana]|eukprot:KAG2484431.1 hypothetical protein HYH03_016741 [Edaphochlamys debaryana]
MRLRNFTSCGHLVYNEVADPETLGETGASAAGDGRTLSHCAYTARPPGTPCSGSGSGSESESGSTQPPNPRAAAGGFQCGGGSLRGLCVPGGSWAAEDEACRDFACDRGTCSQPTPANEGGPCGPPDPGPGWDPAGPGWDPAGPDPCRRSVCRGGRCVAEVSPDDSPCGPAGPCGESVCSAGECVRLVAEDGVMCGPSTACFDRVCLAGECEEERRPDGRLCWHRPGDCPRACVAGTCTACACGPAFAFWAGAQKVPGFQWTPFPNSLKQDSFGGYFNLLAEEVDIPPVDLPYDDTSSVNRYNAESAVLVCANCRLGMRLRPGPDLVQDGVVLMGSVGLAASPTRAGTYVSLDVSMVPNATHNHFLLAWHPWASLSPPPLNSPHRWGDLSGSHMEAHEPPQGEGEGEGDEHQPSPHPGSLGFLGHGLLPVPMRHHQAWAFVERRPVHWAFTTQQQVRALFVGLHLTTASCLRGPLGGDSGEGAPDRDGGGGGGGEEGRGGEVGAGREGGGGGGGREGGDAGTPGGAEAQGGRQAAASSSRKVGGMGAAGDAAS